MSRSTAARLASRKLRTTSCKAVCADVEGTSENIEEYGITREGDRDRASEPSRAKMVL